MEKWAIIILFSITLIISFIIIGFYIPLSISNILDRAGIVFGYLVTCISVAIAIYATLNQNKIKEWFKLHEFENLGEDFDVPVDQIKAMIIPVSRYQQPEWILRWLKPQKVIFIYTNEKREHALKLTEEFKEQIEFYLNSEDITSGKYILENHFDPEQSYLLVKKFIQKLIDKGIPKKNIFADATGGTTPMSVGCFQAAEEMGVSTLYVIGKKNGHIKNPEKKEQGEPIFLSDKT